MPALRYFVPNSITALSMLLGLGSICMSVQGNFRLAAWMILWGVLLDKVDGTAARLLKATSNFGVEFDSFADFVVFGIAPAALLYFHLSKTAAAPPGGQMVLMGAAGFYVVALAVRLARFNITTGDEGIFVGIPGTLLGAILASGYLTLDKYKLGASLLSYSPVILVAAALLMVSTIRLPKLKVRKSKVLNVFQFSNVIAAYILTPLMLFPEYLLGCALLYPSAGIVWCLLHPESAAPEAKGAQNSSADGAEKRLA